MKFQQLVIYADSAHGNPANGARQEGYLIFLVGESSKCILLNWQLEGMLKVAVY